MIRISRSRESSGGTASARSCLPGSATPVFTPTRTTDGFEFSCDACGEVWSPPSLGRGSAPRDFFESWQDAKASGWRAVPIKGRDKAPTWEHRCSDCARALRISAARIETGLRVTHIAAGKSRCRSRVFGYRHVHFRLRSILSSGPAASLRESIRPK
jgi:hypothetical protein